MEKLIFYVDFFKKIVKMTSIGESTILINKNEFENTFKIDEYFKNGTLYKHLELKENEFYNYLLSRSGAIKKIEILEK